ncbi:MAG TPA: S-methyl-5-thioribose-1-phosphate isomerase [bacterium]|nr:S-methyl-5-thioribose-1-phosphate isomerase [bacterium]HPV65280.1 S-methyl-5-thioribose-1-phosphate isomerase [bacterium]
MKNLKQLQKLLPLTVELKKDRVIIIDQVYLPDKLKFIQLKKYSQAILAIKEFNVRGAQAIGAVGGAGVFLASLAYKKSNPFDFLNYLKKIAQEIIKARPTANNLSWAVNKILSEINSNTVGGIKKDIYNSYKKLLESEVNNNLKIGAYGEKLIKNNYRIMTHCNAGSLSAIWYGTATAPIYSAVLNGKKISVLIDETRPWLQGARLTAWEMNKSGIEHRVNIDSASGFLMENKMVDMVIVGADRIALNGDTANKIGTYPLALMSKRYKIPFYIAAVKATIDFDTKTGKEIKIEHRSGDEVLKHTSFWENRNLSKKQGRNFNPLLEISPKGTKAFNPVFDVTPADLITGIITEDGIFKPKEINKLK